jgi:predicted XRE-type DNA-binding protein
MGLFPYAHDTVRMLPGQIQRNERSSASAPSARSSSQDDQDQARNVLIAAIARAMRVRQLNQVQAARLCRTDQPTLSKVLRGRTASVTLDKLLNWLALLGCSVEILVADEGSPDRGLVKASIRTGAGQAEEAKA